MNLDAMFPGPPDWRVAWEEFDAAFDWIRRMRGCPQDRVHHAEGDVWTHARMVCEAMAADTEWRQLPPGERKIVFASALMHDIGKPDCTRNENGRIRSPGHAARGAIMTRGILWRMGWPVAQREQVASLVRHHMKPYWLPEEEDAVRQIHFMSQTARCDWQAILSFADVRGRICADQQHLLDNVALFREIAIEQECLDVPRQFASDHSRFLYFRKPGRDPQYAAFDDSRGEVTLLSGLPGAGKDTWLDRVANGCTVISLDELREELDVEPAGPQGEVVTAARERARVLLRSGEPFVWNATNLSRELRGQVIDLAASYNARVRIVAVETAASELVRRNRERTSPVPAAAVERMLRRWEMPDLTEAHSVSTWEN